MIRPDIVKQLACPAVGLSTSWIIAQKGKPATHLSEVDGQFRREMWPFEKSVCPKDPTRAKELRQKANETYRKGMDHMGAALSEYNMAICAAPEGSEELGLAYANRSAVCFQQKKYHACVKNIELAQMNYPKDKLEKLLERKEKCVKLLEDGQEVEEELDDKNALDKVEVREIANYGQGVVLRENGNVGDILFQENPSILVVEQGFNFKTCDRCGCNKTQAMIPCSSCTEVMYCSELCKNEAFSMYHKFECEIVQDLQYLFRGPRPVDMFRLAFRVFLRFASELFQNRDKFWQRYQNDLKGFRNPQLINNADIHWHVLCVGQQQKKSGDNNGIGMTQFLTVLIYKVAIEENNSIASLINQQDHDRLRDILYGLLFRVKEYCDQGAPQITSVYPMLRMVNHSCAPNAERVFIGGRCSLLLAKRPIDGGEQVLVCYLPGGSTDTTARDERRKQLQAEFDFECECLGCTLDYPKLDDLEENRELAGELETIDQQPNAEERLDLLKGFLQLYDDLYPQRELAKGWKLCLEALLKPMSSC
ncbi:histone-lysine N-methyltransferase SMYD3-like isoform X2 [Uranotaenia lowii]|nr:histone-lysine N-methyltransferase SMYD3-like isoform X2 [Uranotaenia lowii]XP_055592847.1 histone-lysine N-methyltransferase SMYD3-like isoform X2 [Uranotaenia lowii]XP_055592848.1 histone-lysine N-methyltransferase SMYD3-like isoform X2 [Uranotaenia lowii]